MRDIPSAEAAELTTVLTSYGLTAEESAPIVMALRKRPEAWVDFMMRFELGIERPNPRRALRSALTIAGAYVAGGLIPLAPYIAIPRARIALALSAVVTAAALTMFGYVKGHFTGAPPLRSALYTASIGGLAAGAAFLVARAIVQSSRDLHKSSEGAFDVNYGGDPYRWVGNPGRLAHGSSNDWVGAAPFLETSRATKNATNNCAQNRPVLCRFAVQLEFRTVLGRRGSKERSCMAS